MKTSNKPEYFTSILKLPLDRFLDVLIDKDFQALVIEGDPLDAELRAAWENILEEYCDTLSGRSQEYYISLYAKLSKLQSKYNRVNVLIVVLRKCYVKAFADMLTELLSKPFKFDHSRRDEYLKDLDRCLTLNKEKLIKIKLVQNEIDALTQSVAKDYSEPRREDFIKTLIILSDHAGRDLEIAIITVFVYCERLKHYNQFVETKRIDSDQKRRA